MHSVQRHGPATEVRTDPVEVCRGIEQFFADRLTALETAGVGRDRLIIDPGLGYFLDSGPETSLKAVA
ncbi:hypothetical protein FNH09_26600 [Streptomyces adustus]|uniref:Pterin-binding domain-containing protein n=1 Tax=Streptomyces adustus TaxID=1609272 RepID=A0A5N8VHM6_9ACTN|nr:hypothetical protein [Streptomyces adustus]